jgi:flagellar hook assembly protein FlgD
MRFSLASDERVSLSIYDARGVLLRSLEDRVLPAGMHEIVWNGRDAGGRPVAAGVYFARFSAGSYKATRKVMLLK